MRPATLIFGMLCASVPTAQAQTRAAPTNNVERVAPYIMPDLESDGRVTLDIVAGRAELGDDNRQLLVSVEVGSSYRVWRGLRVFGLLPIALVRDDFIDETALGNVSIGALWAHSLVEADSAWRLGGSLTIAAPTARDRGANAAAAFNAVFRRAVWARYLPATTTISLHSHARYESGALFFQGLFGADFLFFEDGVLGANGELFVEARIGVAGGAMLSKKLGIIAELTTVSDFFEDNGVDADEFLHSLDVGIRYWTGVGTFGLRIYVPLNEQYRDDEMVGIGLDFAARL